MTVLDLHAFAEDLTADLIRRHYLAAACVAITRATSEAHVLVDLLDLVDASWFPSQGQAGLYQALLELAPTSGPHGLVTTATVAAAAERYAGGTAAGWARPQINALYQLPVEPNPDNWRELILPIWRRHRARASARALAAQVDEAMSLAATEGRWATALSAAIDLQATLAGLWEAPENDLHPFLAVKAEALGPRNVLARIGSGMAPLDHYLQGGWFLPGPRVQGRLMVLAGRPAMGKSAVGLALATNVALSGHSVLLISLEMGRDQVTRRIHSFVDYKLCLQSGLGTPITSAQLRDQALTPEQRERYAAFDHDDLAQRFHFHRGGFGLTPQEVATQISLARKRDPRLSLVVLDYLTLVDMPGRDPVREVGQLTKLLKRTALDLGIDILVLAQLSRGPESRSNKRPMLSDLRESGRIEEDSDIVLGAYRDAYYNPEADPHDLELLVLKNREGPVGCVRLFSDYAYGAVVASAHNPEPDGQPPALAAALGWDPTAALPPADTDD